VEPLPDEDGSEQYYIEPMVMPVKEPGQPTLFINPSDVIYERFAVRPEAAEKNREVLGYVYARKPPTREDFAKTRSCIATMLS
jgi:hypothetical protein